jgi:hypothetical protein
MTLLDSGDILHTETPVIVNEEKAHEAKLLIDGKY